MDNRPLVFPLTSANYPEQADNLTDDLNTFTWPSIDNDERVFVTIGLSLNEYVMLASALDVGRDIAYNDQSYYVWYLWQRILVMDICQQIADCIENSIITQQAIADSISNSTVIQQAIADYIRESGLNSPTGQISPDDTINSVGATNEDDRIGTIEDCNKDKLWGALRYGVVAYLADNALNFLEDLNTIADKGQRASRLVEGIPVIGNFAAATIGEFSEVIPDLLNLFNAHDSETVRDEIACELFALGCEDCLLPTYGELIGYYSALGVTGYNDLENVAFQLATDLLIGTSTLTASVCYHTLIAYELAVLYVGAKFNQALGANIVNVWALIGEDFANDNWELLCDDCLPIGWCYEITPSTGNYGVALINWGIQDGSGLLGEIKSTNTVGNYTIIPNLALGGYYDGLIFDFGELYLMDDLTVEIEYSYNDALGANDALRLYSMQTITTPYTFGLMYQAVLAVNGNNLTWTRPIDIPQSARYLYIDARSVPSGITIHRVRLTDTGKPRPSGIPTSNC